MITNLQRNGAAHKGSEATAPSLAEQRQATYTAPSLPSKPFTARNRPTGRAWPLAGAVGLLVGGAAAVGIGYAVVPAVPSVAVRQVFVDVDGNGTLDLLLYGEVVLNSGPLAGGE